MARLIKIRPGLWFYYILLGIFVLGAIGLFICHLRTEKNIANQVQKLGGAVEWENSCVRYVYNLRKVDDIKLRTLTDKLASLSSLKSLDISGSKVTDNGLQHLEGLTSLQWL